MVVLHTKYYNEYYDLNIWNIFAFCVHSVPSNFPYTRKNTQFNDDI